MARDLAARRRSFGRLRVVLDTGEHLPTLVERATGLPPRLALLLSRSHAPALARELHARIRSSRGASTLLVGRRERDRSRWPSPRGTFLRYRTAKVWIMSGEYLSASRIDSRLPSQRMTSDT